MLTDAVLQGLTQPDSAEPGQELRARWDLLEAAFALKREPGMLANDVRAIYLAQGYCPYQRHSSAASAQRTSGRTLFLLWRAD